VALAAIDRATLGYVAVAAGATLVVRPRGWPLLLLALVAAALVAAPFAPRARRAGPVARLLAEVYPLLMTVGFYTHAGLVNAERGVSHDALVQSWEQALFAGQPSHAWIRAFPSPAWSTLMHGAYLSYYLVLAAAPLGLWAIGRRAHAARVVLLTMTTFYVCYALFMLFPVAGPRYLFPPADNAATAVPLARLAHRLLEGGSAWGTAFPSSHVAAALVASAAALRGSRPLGAPLLCASFLLSLATVYCQFHYSVDALAGALLAAIVLLVSRRVAV
jgi:membrane-associated phospholipid phosphatase